jgi:hypothetical protein
MGANDFMMREEITSMAERTVDESIISLWEPRTGGLPVADDENHLNDHVKDLNIAARQAMDWPMDQRNLDRLSTRQGGRRRGEGR